MIVLISVITIILYIIVFAFSANNLKPTIDIKTKVIFIVLGLIIITIITSVVFYISANGIEYENSGMVKNVRNIILAVFVPVNGIITMPYLANLLSRISDDDITQEQLKKRIIILFFIFVIVLVFECSYFKNTQLGILDMLNHKGGA